MRPIILLVDHDKGFAYLLQRYAEQCGFACEHALSLQAARALIVSRQPALVLVSRELAGTEAASALAAVQAELAAYDIPLASVAQQAGNPAPALAADYEFTLPLLFDDFRHALMALGIQPHGNDEPRS
jgi:CheY-like chemotaxis protein